MINAVKNYFSEFKVLKTVSKDFWFANGIIFFDSLAYFSMINILTLYLTLNCGFSDVDSGAWVGYFSLFVTAFVFAVGSICDVIGIKRSLYIGVSLLVISRLGLGVLPHFLTGEGLQYGVITMILMMACGTAFMTPISTTAIRRFTTKENRSTGFNVYYLIMNVAAIFSGFAITDGFRNGLGELKGNMAILDFGFGAGLVCMIFAFLINEHNYADESEKNTESSGKRPLAVFMEVWKESAFQKLVLFLLLTIGVRLVFTHQFLVMPKYYTRVMYADFDLGFANSINPLIIVLGLIVLIPITDKFDTFKSIVVGMTISAASLLFMAAPIEWILSIPAIKNVNQAYIFIIYAQIIVFAFGELIFSPRFTEYCAVVAPKEKVASYMALSALPMFIAKPFNGFISGWLIANYSFDGIRAKIDSGNIDYNSSPEYMWMIYLILAVISPVAVVLMRNTLRSAQPKTAENKA